MAIRTLGRCSSQRQMTHAFALQSKLNGSPRYSTLRGCGSPIPASTPNIVDPLGDGSKGDWYLRPIMPPTDADADQGNIWTYGWSESRLCWMPKRQYRSLRQLDEKEDGMKGREMCAHYFEKVQLDCEIDQDEQALDGPELSGKWPHLGEIMNGIDVTNAQDDLHDPQDQRTKVKLEPRASPRPKANPRARDFDFSPYDGRPYRL